MKNLFLTTAIIVSFHLFVSAQERNADLPTLRGDEAVEQLKQNGQYDSLMQAVKDANGQNGRVEDAPDAIGQTAKLTSAGGGGFDNFGVSVAVSGSTAIVGAYQEGIGVNDNQGAAYIFVRAGTGWTQQAQLIAADGAPNDNFGISVAVSGETAIVGAYLDNIGGNGDQGSAYIFTRAGTTWTEQQKLTAADGGAFDYFGYSVAVSGDTAVVGAYADNTSPYTDEGSAYVFTRSGVTWSEQQKLTAADGATGNLFGYSVAVAGDTAIIGSIQDDIDIYVRQGSAYVFVRSGGVWTQQQKLTSSDGGSADNFGVSVALSGETAVIGANQHAVGSSSERGAAYVFVRAGTTWTQQAKFLAADGTDYDRFGVSVAVAGDIAVVSAGDDDIAANGDQGSAYVFVRSGTTWTEAQKLTAADGEVSDFFGRSVAISDSTVIVGAFRNDAEGNLDRGAAYAFRVLGNYWTREAFKVAPDGMQSENFGYSVAVAGDTAIVGASSTGVGAFEQGAAFIFTRSGTNWTQQARLVATDGGQSDFFGISVAIYGDTAIVGAYQDDVGGNVNQGSAYIFTRSGTTWTQEAQILATDGATADAFGVSVALSGETAVIGAYRDFIGTTNPNQGSAYVFTRSGVTWTQQQKLNASDGAANDYFGCRVAVSGDTAIIGAYFDDVNANADQGSAYIFARSGTTWTQQTKLTASDGRADDNFGVSVAISGETAVVGAYADSIGANSGQGSAYVYVRNGAVWTQQAKLLASDGSGKDFFGVSVAISGETVIVGAYLDDLGGNLNQGSAYVFLRSGAVWTQTQRLSGTNGAANDQFGTSVAISGDKIIVGAPLSDISVSNPLSGDFAPQILDQGSVYFYVNAPFSPTAARVSIGGRVFAAPGRGLTNAVVHLTDAAGNMRATRTSSLGYYRFDDIEAGQTVVLTVASKRYQFAPQIVTASGELKDLNFFSEP